jgi:general secretion pathway protein J
MTPRPLRRDAQAGMTLVEVLVSLVLFALIGTAGFSILDQVIRVQRGTEGRLDHLAEIQRGMQILTQDFMQASGNSLNFADGAVSFRRSAGNDEMAVRYGLDGTNLVRVVSDPRSGSVRQILLSGVDGLRWSFLNPTNGWSETWPPRGTEAAPYNPAAVALDAGVTGAGLSGDLRRVAVLPSEERR